MQDRGEQARCWICERTRFDAEAREALEIHGLTTLGMTWDMALELLGWTGTRDELHALAHRVMVIRDEVARND